MIWYMPLLRSCTSKRFLLQINAQVLVTGLHRDALAATKLIQSYANLGCIGTSRLIFDNFARPDSFMWAVMIKSYVGNHFFREAISLYHDMQFKQLQLTSFILTPVLKACSALSDVATGRKIHGKVIKCGFASDAILETSLLQMYGESGWLEDACGVFDHLLTRDVVSWTLLLASYVHWGKPDVGLEIYSRMILENIEPDCVVLLKVGQACVDLESCVLLKSVHDYAIRRCIDLDEKMQNSIMLLYSKCGDLVSAENMFSRIVKRGVIAWTSMISCYNQRSCYREALRALTQMQKHSIEPNSVTMLSVLHSCIHLGCIREGKSVHAFIIKRHMVMDMTSIIPALLSMYATLDNLGFCWNIFQTIQEKTIASWNSIIAAYAQNGSSKKSLELFIQMRKEGISPDSFTLSSSLSSCGHFSELSFGAQIHGNIVKAGFQNNVFVQNSLIGMYCKCGSTDIAYRIFEELEGKDIITWNTMISGFAQNGNSLAAIQLFDQMYSNGLDADEVTFLSAVQACCNLGSLTKGRQIHHKLITLGLKKDTYINTALINMYAKCGDLPLARMVFEKITDKTVVSWSCIISAFASHGQVEDAILFFCRMVTSGTRPNELTFISILSACGHAGMVKQGMQYFELMKEFNIEPQLEHCTCIVDLLSRAGHIERAFDFVNSMPVEPNDSVWRSLLNGCSIHQRTDMVGIIHRRILAGHKHSLEVREL